MITQITAILQLSGDIRVKVEGVAYIIYRVRIRARVELGVRGSNRVELGFRGRGRAG